MDEGYYRISINIGNYREKREKTLEILGRKLAFKAVKTGAKTVLEPMNPYERRIIHTAVQKVRGASSWSEGENLQRHVVIGPDPDYKPSYGGRGGYRKGGSSNFNKDGSYNRRSRSGGYQRRQYSEGESHPQDTMFSAFESDKTRGSINERPESSLYGKIEVKKTNNERENKEVKNKLIFHKSIFNNCYMFKVVCRLFQILLILNTMIVKNCYCVITCYIF